MLEVRDIEYGYPVSAPVGTGDVVGVPNAGDARGADAGLVVRGASLVVHAGERVALLGHNGSGKSTLLRIAAAGVEAWTGEVLLEGRLLSWRDAEGLRAHRAAVGVVGQDPDDQMVASTVFEEVAFGPCNLGVPEGEVRARVTEVLGRCQLAGFEGRDVATLSGGQRQRVALAGVLAMRPRYLLLDEPCSMLDAGARAEVLAAVDDAARDGCGVLHVTHELADVIAYDRALVMDAGRIVWEGTPCELLHDKSACARARCLVSAALKRERDVVRGGVPVPGVQKSGVAANDAGDASGATPRTGEVAPDALVARGVSFSYDDGTRKRRSRRCHANATGHPAVTGVSLDVAPGGAMLVSGLTGSGKSTLLRLLAGLLTPSDGTVTCGGVATSPATVACSFQRTEDQLFADTVLDDVAFGPKNLGCDAEESARRAREALGRVGLDPDVWGARSPFALSGGQMRRVALAGILAMGTPFVALDEPTVGLDADGLRDLGALVRDLRGRGAGVIIVSHDVERCLPLVDELIVMHDGRVVQRCSARKAPREFADALCHEGRRR